MDYDYVADVVAVAKPVKQYRPIRQLYGHIMCIYRRSGERGEGRCGRGRGEKEGERIDGEQRKCMEAVVK